MREGEETAKVGKVNSRIEKRDIEEWKLKGDHSILVFVRKENEMKEGSSVTLIIPSSFIISQYFCYTNILG